MSDPMAFTSLRATVPARFQPDILELFFVHTEIVVDFVGSG
jgi:hypothetical protein